VDSGSREETRQNKNLDLSVLILSEPKGSSFADYRPFAKIIAGD
jgi:hypothetical protein